LKTPAIDDLTKEQGRKDAAGSDTKTLPRVGGCKGKNSKAKGLDSLRSRSSTVMRVNIFALRIL